MGIENNLTPSLGREIENLVRCAIVEYDRERERLDTARKEAAEAEAQFFSWKIGLRGNPVTVAPEDIIRGMASA